MYSVCVRESGRGPRLTWCISYQDNNCGGLLTAVRIGNMMRDRKEKNMDGQQLKGGETLVQGDRHEDRLTDETNSYTSWSMAQYTK